MRRDRPFFVGFQNVFGCVDVSILGRACIPDRRPHVSAVHDSVSVFARRKHLQRHVWAASRLM